MTVASLDVDSQRTFSELCPDELPVLDGEAIVGELNAQAKLARYRCFSKDAHPANPLWLAAAPEAQLRPTGLGNADVTWVRHATVGTDGFELLPGLPKASDYDFFVYKGVERDMHPYGACFQDTHLKISTGLIEWLRDKGVDTVIVGGLALDYCVKTTVLQLVEQGGFRVILNLAATRGLAEETSVEAVRRMSEAGALIAQDAEDVARLLG